MLLVQVAEERLGAVDDLVVGVGEHGDPSASNVCSSIAAASIASRGCEVPRRGKVPGREVRAGGCPQGRRAGRGAGSQGLADDYRRLDN